MELDIAKIRKDFPVLHQEVYKKPLVYLDNAATTQKPQCVIDTLSRYYAKMNSNIHRGAHFLSNEATEAFERTRTHIQHFLNAESTEEIIFTRGTTESINLVAQSFGKMFVNEGDEILISNLEHHSNIVPWQMMCESRGAVLKVIPVDEHGDIVMDAYRNLLSDKTKLVSVAHVSNALGTILPVEEIVELAHQKGAKVMIDGAQAVSHLPIDVQKLNCDFYAFSAHKLYGPMGVGVLYGKAELLNAMPPYQGGGEMIKEVSFEATTYNELPFKFEAGTPNVGDVLAFNEALNYIEGIGISNIAEYENELLDYASEKLSAIEGLKIIGTAKHKTSVASFILEGIHHFDAGTVLDKLGIAIRTGHHCAQPVMKRFEIGGTIRASFSFYNTKEEVDTLVEGIVKVQELFA